MLKFTVDKWDESNAFKIGRCFSTGLCNKAIVIERTKQWANKNLKHTRNNPKTAWLNYKKTNNLPNRAISDKLKMVKAAEQITSSDWES